MRPWEGSRNGRRSNALSCVIRALPGSPLPWCFTVSGCCLGRDLVAASPDTSRKLWSRKPPPYWTVTRRESPSTDAVWMENGLSHDAETASREPEQAARTRSGSRERRRMMDLNAGAPVPRALRLRFPPEGGSNPVAKRKCRRGHPPPRSMEPKSSDREGPRASLGLRWVHHLG